MKQYHIGQKFIAVTDPAFMNPFEDIFFQVGVSGGKQNSLKIIK